MSAISVSNLTKKFHSAGHEVVALDAFSHVFSSGEMHVISGRSGSGKSTLLNSIAGLLTPDSGEILYADTSLYQLNARQRNAFRASEVGILYPDFRLLPYLDIRENIATPSLELDWNKAQVEARTKDLIEQFGLQERANHLPAQLSSGEQQRTALARALLASPAIIIADEPTGNLDEENSLLIIDTLKSYAEQGNTVIIASHDPIAIGAAHHTLNLEKGILI
jgi:putative ABC transport system ATP-binding protein